MSSANFPEPEALPSTDPWLTRNFDQASLKQQSVRGGLLMFAAKGGAQSLRLVTTLILTRVLTPADFGLVAMILAVIGIAVIFRDLGLSSATIQRDKLTTPQVSALFCLNTGLGALMTLLGLFAAPWLERFYAHPGLSAVASALAVSFVINGVAAQHLALLRRNLKFRELARLQLIAVGVSSCVAVALALSGAGAWALVAHILIGDLVSLALAWHYCTWRPRQPGFDAGVMEMLRYGGHFAGFSLFGYFCVNLHLVLIGRFWGPALTGFYSRAQFLQTTLASYINDPLTSVAVPALSGLAQQPDKFRNYFLKCSTFISYAAAPMGFYFIAFAQPIVEVLLGPQWERTGQLFQIMAVGFALQPLCNSSGWIFLARGDTRRMLRWGVLAWTLGTLAALLGLRYGLEGVAVSYSACLLLLFWPCMAYAFQDTLITFSAFLAVCARPFLAAAASVGAVYLLDGSLGIVSPWSRLMVSLPICIALYLGLLLLLGQRETLMTALAQLRRPEKA
jgi:PST family polysaccharide transporter